MTHTYGWIRDLPDQQDWKYAIPRQMVIPPIVDLRSACPAVYDQLQLGSCTANAAGGAFEYELKKQGLTDFIPSRLFLYYWERSLERTTKYDSGASIRDSIRVLAKRGVCHETSWPYDIAKFTVKPPLACTTEARKSLVTSYLRLDQDLTQMKACLASGYPFIFGFTVYSSFESDEVAKNGIVPLPQQGEQNMGGHAVMAVGYHDTEQAFIIRNSWGPDWGQAGYCMMPYAYLLSSSLSSDFWTIRTVE